MADTPTPAPADKPPVTLFRGEDGYITPPMPADEAAATMAGYPGMYIVYQPTVPGVEAAAEKAADDAEADQDGQAAPATAPAAQQPSPAAPAGQ